MKRIKIIPAKLIRTFIRKKKMIVIVLPRKIIREKSHVKLHRNMEDHNIISDLVHVTENAGILNISILRKS